jgi:hypothetical protein
VWFEKFDFATKGKEEEAREQEKINLCLQQMVT